MKRLLCGLNILLMMGLFFALACGSPEPVNRLALDQALQAAVAGGNLAVVDSSLQAGADPNHRDGEGTPVVINAAISGRRDIVAKLVEYGADVNARRGAYFRTTALMEIAAKNDTAMAAYLLDKGADVAIRDTFGDPAVNWASYYGHIAFVEKLLASGARLDVESRNGTALDIAMKQGHDELVDYMIGKGAGKPLPADQEAVVMAVKRGSLDDLRKQIETGADVNQVDPVGTPLLVLAASAGHEDLVRYLLREKADPDLQNRVGQTALSRAARFGHRSIVARLLEKGADPNLAGDKYRLTPLISAAIGGHTAIGRLLIGNGAAIDAQEGIEGYTPLMYATAFDHPDMVKLLLEAGANPYIKGYDGTELYDMVSFSNNPEINAIIQDYLMQHQ